jgi:hypothetical protein
MSRFSLFEALESRRLMSGDMAALIGLTDQNEPLGELMSLFDSNAVSRRVSAGGTLAQPDLLRTLPHREQCSGILTDVQPGVLFFAGSGVASYFGRYSIEGSNNFDNLGNVTDGVFTTMAADGSTISGIYFGTYAPLAGTQVRFNVHVEWQQGTGRLEGVTGQAEVVAILEDVAPGAAFEYVTDGTLTFPG